MTRAGRRHAQRHRRRRRRRPHHRGHRARHHRLQRDPGRCPAWNRSTIITSGATTAPGAKPPRSPPPRTHANLAAIDWCGGIYSSEWGFAKLLHWLRHNPEKRARFATALEHCDMVAAVLCGITDPAAGLRAASAPWATSGCGTQRSGGLPAGRVPRRRRSRCSPASATSSAAATPPATASPDTSAPEWAAKLGLRAGIPIPVGAFDAHWDAIGAGVPHRRRGQRGRHLHLHHGHQRASPA